MLVAVTSVTSPKTSRSATADHLDSSQVLDSPSKGHGVYRCECGHEERVFGGGRHRIYFPVESVQLDDPIMDRSCSVCGRILPSYSHN
jgi:hypothetical protein